MTNSCPIIDSPTPGLTPLKRESSRTKTGGQIPTYVAFAPKNGMSILVDQCSEISKLEAMYFLSQAIRQHKRIAVPPRATGHVFKKNVTNYVRALDLRYFGLHMPKSLTLDVSAYGFEKPHNSCLHFR
jgi:hypothetical protein